MKQQNEIKGRQQWNSPLEDYNLISEDSCKFLFEQAKLYFEETVEESEQLTERGIRILFLLLPAVAAIIAFWFSNQSKLKPLQGWSYVILLCSVLSIVFCLYNLFRLISPKTVHYRGTKPEDMMRPEIFKLKEPVQIEKALYISEIEQMEIRNSQRITIYRRIVYSFNLMMGSGIALLLRSI